jgi:biotin transport system substrate-specific component
MASERVKKLVHAALFAALTAAAAWVMIPLPYVPVTLQTFFVILAGALLGAYFGALSMVAYLLLGFIGLPVFAGGQSGLGVLAGATGGYLVGFIFCAIVTGLVVKMKRSPGFLWYCLAMAAGTMALYACGVLQLSAILHMPLARAAIVGALPFVPGDTIKIIIASTVAAKLHKDREGRR